MMDLSTKQGRKEQGKRIQQAAESAGLSLEALARAIGCSRALIYQYVSGTTLAQPDKVQRIAAATGVPLSRFYDTEETPPLESRDDRSPSAQETTVSAPVSAPSTVEAPPSSRVDEHRLRQSLLMLQDLARAHASGPDPAARLSVSQRIIPLARELGDLRAEAEALFTIGDVQLSHGELQAARQTLEEALRLFATLRASDRELACRQTLGAVLTAAGDVTGARAQFEQVAKAVDLDQRWKGLLSLGALAEWQGNYQNAMTWLDKAEAELEQSGDPARVRTARPYLGANRVNVFLGCGDYRNALHLTREAFADAESSGNPDQYVESQLNIGVCLTALGDYVAALDWLQRARQVARLLGDAPRETTAVSCLAETLCETGRFEEAKSAAREAVTAALAGNTSRCCIQAHRALGTVYLRTGLADEALYHLEQAAQVARTVRMAGSRLWCDLRLAEARLLAEGETCPEDEAKKVAEHARDSGSEHVEAEARLLIAECRLAAGDPAAGRSESGSALNIASACGLPEVRLRALHALARAVEMEGDTAGAEKKYQSALVVLRRLRRQFAQADQPDTLLEDRRRARLCADYVRFLLAQQRMDDAHRVVERCNWPPLQDLLQSSVPTGENGS